VISEDLTLGDSHSPDYVDFYRGEVRVIIVVFLDGEALAQFGMILLYLKDYSGFDATIL
jgi:hypothetical protein